MNSATRICPSPRRVLTTFCLMLLVVSLVRTRSAAANPGRGRPSGADRNDHTEELQDAETANEEAQAAKRAERAARKAERKVDKEAKAAERQARKQQRKATSEADATADGATVSTPTAATDTVKPGKTEADMKEADKGSATGQQARQKRRKWWHWLFGGED